MRNLTIRTTSLRREEKEHEKRKPELPPPAEDPLRGKRIRLSSKHPSFYYYNKSARGKWNRASQVVEGMRWNAYKSSGKETPLPRPLSAQEFAPMMAGLMRELKHEEQTEPARKAAHHHVHARAERCKNARGSRAWTAPPDALPPQPAAEGPRAGHEPAKRETEAGLLEGGSSAMNGPLVRDLPRARLEPCHTDGLRAEAAGPPRQQGGEPSAEAPPCAQRQEGARTENGRSAGPCPLASGPVMHGDSSSGAVYTPVSSEPPQAGHTAHRRAAPAARHPVISFAASAFQPIASFWFPEPARAEAHENPSGDTHRTHAPAAQDIRAARGPGYISSAAKKVFQLKVARADALPPGDI